MRLTLAEHARVRASSREAQVGPCVKQAYIIGARVDPTSYADACQQIMSWCSAGIRKYICVATVNNVMEAYDSPHFRRVMNEADLVTPDGMPLVWALRLLGYKYVTRVYGPDLTAVLLEKAAAENLAVGFYGAAPEVLQRLVQVVGQRFPRLQIAYAFSPPFAPLDRQGDEQIVRDINTSGTRILFIGLNTPKQDHWMAEHKRSVKAVMIGVGAAFDFLAGSKPQAPRWMMRSGLEWLFRLVTEPRRLWKRYLKHNPRFIVLFALQLLGLKTFPSGSAPQA